MSEELDLTEIKREAFDIMNNQDESFKHWHETYQNNVIEAMIKFKYK